MNINNIKTLIEAFYEGNTSVEEEQFLFDYFANEEIPEELLSEKKYFEQLQKLTPVKIPERLTLKMDKLFDDLEKHENKTSKIKQIILWIGSAAAIIIMIFTGYYYNQDKNPINMDDSLFAVKTVKTDSQVITVPDCLTTPEYEISFEDLLYTDEYMYWDKYSVSDDYKKMEAALKMVSVSLDQGLNQLNFMSDNLPKTAALNNL